MPTAVRTKAKEELPASVSSAPVEEGSDPFSSIEKKDAKKYFEAIGRRKRAVARVRLFTANPKESALKGGFVVNDKTLKGYFGWSDLVEVSMESLNKLKGADHFRVLAKVKGGGIGAQAAAIRLGVARALVKFDGNFRKKLKKAGLLRRDPREKERRKYGLKKARRAPQFSKR